MDKIAINRTTLKAPDKLDFKAVKPLLERPLEISRAQLRGLNMVDETIIVRSALRAREAKRWIFSSVHTTR